MKNLIKTLFLFLSVSISAQELSPKEVTNLHIKAIVNSDSESIDKLGKYFSQIAVEPNEHAFDGFKTMYDEMTASVFETMINNEQINKKLAKDAELKNAVTQTYGKLYSKLRKVDCKAQSVKTEQNEYVENQKIATITYKCVCDIPDYSKVTEDINEKLTKSELLKRLQKLDDVITNTSKKVEFTKEYRLFESPAKGKIYWENGSMTELISDIFGELLPNDGRL